MGLGQVGAILVGASWLALGYCFGVHYPPAHIIFLARFSKQAALANDSNNGKNKTKKNKQNKDKPKDPLEIENLADILEDFKMVSL